MSQPSDLHLFYNATNDGLTFWESEFSTQKQKKPPKVLVLMVVAAILFGAIAIFIITRTLRTTTKL